MSNLDSMSVRIELRDSSKIAAVGDYFRRLGARATIRNGCAVEIEFPEGSLSDDESIDEYLRSWSTKNGVDVTATAALAAASDNVSLPVLSASAPPPKLGQLLVTKGYISDDQLAAALVESRTAGDILGKTLIRSGYIFESELARTLAEQWGLPYVNLASVGVDPDAVRALPREVGERFAAIPVRNTGAGVQVAFVDPSDEEAGAAVRQYIPEVSPAVADHSDIVMSWRSFR